MGDQKGRRKLLKEPARSIDGEGGSSGRHSKGGKPTKLSKAEQRAQEELKRQEEILAREAAERRAALASEALARLQDAQRRGDDAAVEDELTRGELPMEIASVRWLYYERYRAKRVAEVQLEFAEELAEAEAEMRKAKLELSRVEAESAAEVDREAEALNELQEDMEQLRFEEENSDVVAPGRWKPRTSTEANELMGPSLEMMRWSLNVERTKGLMKAKQILLDDALEMWREELEMAEELTADIRLERDQVVAQLEEEKAKWLKRLALQDQSVGRPSSARVKHEAEGWAKKRQQMEEEVQRAREVKKASAAAWSSSLEVMRDEVDILELQSIDMGKRLEEAKLDASMAGGGGGGIKAGWVGLKIKNLVGSVLGGVEKDDDGASAEEQAAAAHEDALRARVALALERQRAKARWASVRRQFLKHSPPGSRRGSATSATGVNFDLPTASRLPAPPRSLVAALQLMAKRSAEERVSAQQEADAAAEKVKRELEEAEEAMRLAVASAARAGKLKVELIRAIGLKAGDRSGRCNPYVKLSLNGQQLKSKVLTKTFYPEWGEHFDFIVDSLNIDGMALELQVCDSNPGERDERDDELLGDASVALVGLQETLERDVVTPLSRQGEVHLELRWEPPVPAKSPTTPSRRMLPPATTPGDAASDEPAPRLSMVPVIPLAEELGAGPRELGAETGRAMLVRKNSLPPSALDFWKELVVVEKESIGPPPPVNFADAVRAAALQANPHRNSFGSISRLPEGVAPAAAEAAAEDTAPDSPDRRNSSGGLLEKLPMGWFKGSKNSGSG